MSPTSAPRNKISPEAFDLISIEEIASTDPEASIINSRDLDSAFSIVYRSKFSCLSPQLTRNINVAMDRVNLVLFILVNSV